jgi:hypothetical protein
MTTPFDETVVDEAEVQSPELDEVDTPTAEPEGEIDLPAGDTAKTDAASDPSTAAVPKKATKPPVPAGFITPVAFAHTLTEKLRGTKQLAEGEVFPPQMVYSWVKAGQKSGAKDGLPSYSEGGRDNLLKADEAMAWYDRKDQRVADRKAAKEKKAAEAAAKASATPATAAPAAPTEPVQEVE